MSNIGRVAVEAAKVAFRDKGLPLNLGDAASYLRNEGVPARLLGKAHVREWLRKAILELTDDGVTVTNPVAANGWVRNPNATPDERIISWVPTARDIRTRVANFRKIMGCAAGQVDGTPEEQAAAIFCQAMEDLAEKLEQVLASRAAP